jgi:N6-L-threonylcarbamoyladenine synthase
MKTDDQPIGNDEFIVLGIESSCDDTGDALVTGDRKILANIVISQNSEHEKFQGVVPEIAARSHMKNLDNAIKSALNEANIAIERLSAIAATSGPGLIGGVITGCMYAKALSSTLNKPFIAINHLEGHALTARLTNDISYPYLLLLASGGHCQFVAVLELGSYKILGATLDDAVGEAFDKVAKMLNLPFPGGPHIERRAKLGDAHKYTLPKPIIHQQNCNMSFSGLKTSVNQLIRGIGELNDSHINDIAASFQYTIAQVLSAKTLRAVELFAEISNSKNIVIAGGVAANQYLKEYISKKISVVGYSLITPPISLCTDNAAMIAYAGVERYSAKLFNSLDFCPRARWSLEEI